MNIGRGWVPEGMDWEGGCSGTMGVPGCLLGDRCKGRELEYPGVGQGWGQGSGIRYKE